MKPEELKQGALYVTRLGVVIEYTGESNPGPSLVGYPFHAPLDGETPAVVTLTTAGVGKLRAHVAPRVGSCMHCLGRIPEPELIALTIGKRNNGHQARTRLCRFCVADIVGELAQQLRH